MTKRTMNTNPGVENIVYADNASETKTNYMDENETDYGDFEDVDLEITRNNISLFSPPLSRKPDSRRQSKYGRI